MWQLAIVKKEARGEPPSANSKMWQHATTTNPPFICPTKIYGESGMWQLHTLSKTGAGRARAAKLRAGANIQAATLKCGNFATIT